MPQYAWAPGKGSNGSFVRLASGEWREVKGMAVGEFEVVQRRLKQAGLRWAPQHVDPLLTLRDLICNERWSEGWDDIVNFQLQQQR